MQTNTYKANYILDRGHDLEDDPEKESERELSARQEDSGITKTLREKSTKQERVLSNGKGCKEVEKNED